MKSLFIDTNVFLRFLTDDHPDHSLRARNFLDSVIHTTGPPLLTSDAVILEMVYTLRTFYQVSQKETETQITTLTQFCKILRPAEEFDWQTVFYIERTYKVDFIDALNYQIMKQESIDTIISFDTDFDRLDDITRREP